MDNWIPETGGMLVHFYPAMKLYIGLSSVKTANDILLTGMLNPAMFTNGPFRWPLRLMQHLSNLGKQLTRLGPEDIDKKYARNYLVKEKSWWCANCKENMSQTKSPPSRTIKRIPTNGLWMSLRMSLRPAQHECATAPCPCVSAQSAKH